MKCIIQETQMNYTVAGRGADRIWILSIAQLSHRLDVLTIFSMSSGACHSFTVGHLAARK